MVPAPNNANAGTTKDPDPQVLCLLTSGQTAVCKASQCLAEHGQIQSKIIDVSVTSPTAGQADELFLYQTPHGINVIGTFANAQVDNGTILGKWNGEPQTHLAASTPA